MTSGKHVEVEICVCDKDGCGHCEIIRIEKDADHYISQGRVQNRDVE